MNKYQLATAYATLTHRYGFNRHQRDALDRSDVYTQLMQLVHDENWTEVDTLIQQHDYFDVNNDPKFELVD